MTDTIPTVTDTPAPLFSQAVCLLVELTRLGNRRKVPSGALTPEGTDPEAVHVSKELLESQAYDAITAHDGETRAFLRDHCLPNPMFRGGVSLISHALVARVDSYLRHAQEVRTDLIEAFLSQYETAKADAEVRLGTLFNDADYPPVEAVRTAFGFRWQYLSVDTPRVLRSISADIFAREQQKAAAVWTDAVEQGRTMLAGAFQDLVSHLAERLEPGPDGKPKVFRNSLVENLRGFLDSFAERVPQAMQSDEINALVREASVALSGVDAEALRKNPLDREDVRARFASIKATLDGMVTAGGKRRYSVEG